MTTAHQEITREKKKIPTQNHPCAKRKGDAKLFSKKIMLENWAVIWKDNFRLIASYAAHVFNLYANKQ